MNYQLYPTISLVQVIQQKTLKETKAIIKKSLKSPWGLYNCQRAVMVSRQLNGFDNVIETLLMILLSICTSFCQLLNTIFSGIQYLLSPSRHNNNKWVKFSYCIIFIETKSVSSDDLMNKQI